MDEICQEKEEYLADGVLWSDNHSNTSSDTKTVFERISCGSELNLARACGPISIECRERFRQRLRRIIHRLSDLVRANPFSKEAESSTNAPLSTNFWIVLSKLEVDEVFNILLSHFPEQVQATLGKPTVTIDGLLALPHQDNLGGWIVYIDIVTESIILDDGKETGVGSQTHGLGLYVGSATGQGGGIQRWSEYDRYVPNNLSKDDYSRKGYHHWFCTRPGHTMNLRAVAVGFCPLDSTFWPILTEGIIMVLLGTLSDKGQRKQFTPKAMFDWYEECRKAIPDVGRFPDVEPLNHSWPLRQGFRRCIPRPTSCPHCGLTPLGKTIWLRTEAKHVCPGCWERSFKGQKKRQTARNSGQVKCGRPACDWKFGPYIDPVKKTRPGIAPKSGISDRWLCQPCFEMAMKIAEANGVVHVRANRGPTVKEAGVFHCQNPKCKRPLERNKKKNERPAERPRPGISDCWLCINCFRKARRGTLCLPALST